MEYSRYFGKMICTHGMPHMSVASFQKMMNIVLIEGRIDAIKKYHPDPQKILLELKYDLEALTDKKTPEVLLKEMMEE